MLGGGVDAATLLAAFIHTSVSFTGYSVVGKLANYLLTEPKEIQTTSGDWVHNTLHK